MCESLVPLSARLSPKKACQGLVPWFKIRDKQDRGLKRNILRFTAILACLIAGFRKFENKRKKFFKIFLDSW
jgi:hypothetical protein